MILMHNHSSGKVEPSEAGPRAHAGPEGGAHPASGGIATAQCKPASNSVC
ncbi:hypothetical protein [Variovorax boronicumulans]